MKLLQILENSEQGIKEQGGLLRALGSGIKSLAKQTPAIKQTFDDVIKFSLNKGEKSFFNSSSKEITKASDLYKNAIRKFAAKKPLKRYTKLYFQIIVSYKKQFL